MSRPLEDVEAALPMVWESLCASPATPDELKTRTGLQQSLVSVTVGRLFSAGLLHKKEVVYHIQSEMTPMLWAKAVELGIPLSVLEKTVPINIRSRRQAESHARSGTVDREVAAARKRKSKDRMLQIRGRAASEAAATDLAMIIHDTNVALAKSNSPIALEMRNKAREALNLLIKEMERR